MFKWPNRDATRAFNETRVRPALQRVEVVIALERERVALLEPLHHVRSHVPGVGQHAEPSPRRRERVLARLARIVRHGIRLHVDAADRQRAVAAQVLHARDRRQRARGARRHPNRRVVPLRERRDALRVIRVLVSDEIGRDVARLAIDGLQALLDDLARQSAVDHQQRRAELDERGIAAAAAAEREEAQRHERCCSLSSQRSR